MQRENNAGLIDKQALQQRMAEEGADWYELTASRCPHLFADVAVSISASQLQSMKDVIAAAEYYAGRTVKAGSAAQGVFYGYDFHLNDEGVHLIEINTNAGGAFLNALLIESQQGIGLPGEPLADACLAQSIVEMFRCEWQLARKGGTLACIAIVDEHPETQYLYSEFLLAKKLFERCGIKALIVDPDALHRKDGALYFGEDKVDMVYNRLTDFSLQHHSELLGAWTDDEVVLTPNPDHYVRYADKRNLAALYDANGGVLPGLLRTFVVEPQMEERLWQERKQYFFKPNSGYGSRGAYRGDKLTRRVFGEIMQSDYVAQQLASPGECAVAEGGALKYDVRCYVYRGRIQLVAARLYQGQTTNFRTPGGGFAIVRLLG